MSIQVRLRTSYQVGTLGVDRTSDVVRGVVGMQTGEALGHRMMADTRTLAMTRDLSNEAGGLPSRFGHPGISENATGKKLGNGRNFSLSDHHTLRFDLHMMQAARNSPVFGQDPVEYVLNVAQEAPSELGMSYVLRTDLAWALQDGTERPLSDDEAMRHSFDDLDTPVDSLFEFPVMRPTSVHFVDIVNEGALTSDSGLLEVIHLFDGRSSEYLHEIFSLVDEWRTKYSIPLNEVNGKVENILQEYMNSRGGNMSRNKYPKGGKPRAPKPAFVGEIGELESDMEKLAVLAGESDGPSDGDVTSDLDELAADLSAVTDELTDSEEELSADQYTHLQEQVAYALGNIETLRADQQKITAMLRECIDGLQTLSRNQSRLSGEPVVTERVSVTPRQPLEQLEFAHPEPTNVAAAPRNQLSAAQRNVAINNARMQRYAAK